MAAILRTPAFYLLAFGSMCSIAAVGGTNQHLKLFLSLDRGYSQGDAARVISLVLACSIAGRLLMGWLADRMPKKFVMLGDLFAGGGVDPAAPGQRLLAHAALSVRHRVRHRAGRRIHDHSADGGELFGVTVLGRVLGIVLTADGVAEATAPMLVGYLRDINGTYNAGFFTLIGAALAGAAAIALLPSRRPPRSPCCARKRGFFSEKILLPSYLAATIWRMTPSVLL